MVSNTSRLCSDGKSIASIKINSGLLFNFLNLKYLKRGTFCQLYLFLDCNVSDMNAADEDDCGFSDFTSVHAGNYPSTCVGQLVLWHGQQGNVASSIRKTVVIPGFYKNTRRIFRRRVIIRAETWGNCPWKIYSSRRFKGRVLRLEPGFKSHLDFTPASISQRD